jgi:hypothetical protein
MQIVQTPGAIQRLRRSLGRSHGQFQQTFVTPLKQLRVFTTVVLAAHAPIESGSVNLEQVVFTPKNLERLLLDHRLPLTYGEEWTITAGGPQESAALLRAVWGDWIDFYFTPAPKRYQIFADHDEYTTIFAAAMDDLARVATALTNAGFSPIDGYQRQW